ncbi:MAG: farnesyl pyrophosphate synthetase [Osedax symbiont Rs1]|nr:MAG: farnesyl pyrophosphate synthetase [Osedax symbiont Rs1]
MQPHQLNPIIEPQFLAVNDYIINHLGSTVPLVEKIGHYIVSSGGKRFRPLLVLLASNACNHLAIQNTVSESNPAHIKLAATIEFIHTATLLHDDVVDSSDLRRGKDTANAKWGNGPSVLVGDFLYSRAFQIMVEIGELEIMNVISNATNVIAEGEVLQLLNSRNPDLSEDDYMKVIIAKTAKLFEAATETGAILASASDKERTALKNYGLHLGIAFQLIDDVMDYISSAAEMGKNTGDDLAEGKTTLPLIQAMKETDDTNRKLIRRAIRDGGLQDLAPVLKAIKQTNAIQYTQQKAFSHSQQAIDCLDDIQASSFRDTLIDLAKLAVSRKS